MSGATDRSLVGRAAAPGHATGVAHVIADAACVRPVPRGAVLVARIIHPHMAPLLSRVAGVVVEEGARLQHATTLAREFGVPAVVGLVDATTLLRDGDLLEIDGGTGTIVVRARTSGDAPHYVESFDCEMPDPARLGGKGASLCRLTRSGYRVPAGFVVTVDAFSTSLAAMGLGPTVKALDAALAGPGDIPLPGDEVCGALRAGRVPDAILQPILRAAETLELWRHGGVIVRSSATVEDGAAHSFAGIFESIPITSADALEPTIREVWCSVFSPRALTYFREVGLGRLPAMAVVVQRFIRAQRSGVMFTTYGGRTLVEHVEGDCEKLVKGEVTPEQLWIEGGRLPYDTGLLAQEHAAELVRLAGTLEDRFGAPQDVEWVLVDDLVHVVQSRPITTSTEDAGDGEAVAGTVDGSLPVLTGIPASGGFGAGDVHPVFNIEDALAIETGRVLVTPMTNPDMVVAMRKSAAIVTDVGGMICHAAIVSRELGLPCVVGTGTATTTLRPGELVTVAGSAGAVYRGTPAFRRTESKRPGTWADLWRVWAQATAARPDLMPHVSSLDALEALTGSPGQIVLDPTIDLRTGPNGLWVDLEAMAPGELSAHLDAYLERAATLARGKAIPRLYIRNGGSLPDDALTRAVERAREPLVLHERAAVPVVEDALSEPPAGAAVPLAAAALLGTRAPRPRIGGMDQAKLAAVDTMKFFGHKPGSHESGMPAPERRGSWWELLPEYGRFHRDHATAAEAGVHTWLEIRPELVISALLKSLVQPGFEMVPRAMGFPDLPPMHIKWMKCRYHFRSDTFARVWGAIVHGTWDTPYMADLMRRVRRSYDQLGEVLVLFPTTDADRAALSPEQIVALITSWWPRWVEFFALCWFIQAQGDDILYPFVDETVADNRRRLAGRGDDFEWPGAPELIAPTTPVLSGEYMADVARVREVLLAVGLTGTDEALAALERGEQPELGAVLAGHLARWHWMRDRDLLFEPWDTPARVIDTALKTEPHAPVPYEANLRRNRFALSVHYDLAAASGRAAGLNHAARFLHDLNVERENHHVLWLKLSYPLRCLILEVERRLVANGSLEGGEIFFLQAPELIAAARKLPEPLPAEMVARVRDRRRGFRHEARLARAEEGELVREDDYF